MTGRPARLLSAVLRRLRGALAGMPRSPRSQGFTDVAPLDAATLERFERRLARLSEPEESALDPTTHAHDFRQPNQVSCGAASLVFSRMIHDRPYAMWLMTGHDPRTGRSDSRTISDRWTSAVLDMHRQVTRLRDHDGDLQWPWLRMIGTPPWAAARQLEGAVGASGVPGAAYAARTVDPDELGAEFDAVVDAVRAGHTVPLYVGNDLRPAHVTLVVSAGEGHLRIYEPSAGRMVDVSREAFVGGTFKLGGWAVPWFTVLPR